MLKVVIADDEQRVGLLVRYLIHWEELGLEFAGQCCDGQSAWELIEQIHPDIVITDIRMPVLTGLELVQRTSEKYPQIRFVIISGYRYFEYAQKALKYGVIDYLLKPIDEDELNAILRKICQTHVEQERDRVRTEQIEKNYNSNLRLLERELLHRLVIGDVPEELERLRKEHDTDIPDGLYQAALVQVDHLAGPESSSEQRNMIMMRAQKTAQDILKTYHVMLCIETEMRLFALLYYNREDKAGVQEAISRWMDECRHYLNNFAEYTVTMGVSRAEPEFAQVPELLQEAEQATARKLLEGSGGQLKLSVEERMAEAAPAWMEKARKNLEVGLETLRPEALRKNIVENFADAQKAGAAAWQYMELTRNTLQWFEGGCQERGMALPQGWARAVWLDCRSSQSIRGLIDILTQALGCTLEQLQAERRKSEDYPIRIAMEYVQQHYPKKVTLEEAASRSGFNTTYFSEMFKHKTGKGFLDYVTEVRINAAKEMLRNTRKTVYEIAESVGYRDVKYFSQQFTKNVGMKPTEYRKLYY